VTRAREWLEYCAFRFVAAIFAALPLEFAANLSGWSWGLIAPLLPRHQRALEHLAQALPEMTAAERERIAGEMWRHLGRTFAEFFHLARILVEKRVDFVPIEDFVKVADSAPFVVCIPHLGNWEVASQAGLRFGAPLAGTYQALTNPLVDNWLLEKRKPMYAGGLFPRASRRHFLVKWRCRTRFPRLSRSPTTYRSTRHVWCASRTRASKCTSRK
jgi:KDO2-lipid IV(A) lauroyltransferase